MTLGGKKVTHGVTLASGHFKFENAPARGRTLERGRGACGPGY